MKTHIENWKAQKPYAVEFHHNGARWALTIHAVDDADAEAKVQSLRESAVLLGGPVEVINCSDAGEKS